MFLYLCIGKSKVANTLDHWFGRAMGSSVEERKKKINTC